MASGRLDDHDLSTEVGEKPRGVGNGEAAPATQLEHTHVLKGRRNVHSAATASVSVVVSLRRRGGSRNGKWQATKCSSSIFAN